MATITFKALAASSDLPLDAFLALRKTYDIDDAGKLVAHIQKHGSSSQAPRSLTPDMLSESDAVSLVSSTLYTTLIDTFNAFDHALRNVVKARNPAARLISAEVSQNTSLTVTSDDVFLLLCNTDQLHQQRNSERTAAVCWYAYKTWLDLLVIEIKGYAAKLSKSPAINLYTELTSLSR